MYELEYNAWRPDELTLNYPDGTCHLAFSPEEMMEIMLRELNILYTLYKENRNV